MAVTRTTSAESPSLIFTGMAGFSGQTLAYTDPRWSGDFRERGEGCKLHAHHHDESRPSIADGRRPKLEQGRRKQEDETGHNNQGAPPELRIPVKAGTEPKRAQ